MCFSATASFGAGTALAVIGVVSLRQAETKSELLFAGVPLLFSVQQLTEGLVWLSFANPPDVALNTFTTYVFLIFAQVFWPLWIPLAVALMTQKEMRRKVQWLFVAMGALEAIYQTILLLNFPSHSAILGHHIYYNIEHPATFNRVEPLFYIGAILAPPFFSRVKGMFLLGAANLVSCLITFIFYTQFTFSIWCFFAAIISVVVLLILKNNRAADSNNAGLVH